MASIREDLEADDALRQSTALLQVETSSQSGSSTLQQFATFQSALIGALYALVHVFPLFVGVQYRYAASGGSVYDKADSLVPHLQ